MSLNLAHSGETISIPEWNGSKPCRFKGGKIASIRPNDQLDNVLMGNYYPLFEDNGRKHYNKEKKLQGNQQSLKRMRKFQQYYKSSKIFQIETIKKLIKLDKNHLEHANAFNRSNELKTTNSVGLSKMKQLQTGNKKTGIYRNFYKSQVKSLSKVGNEQTLISFI